ASSGTPSSMSRQKEHSAVNAMLHPQAPTISPSHGLEDRQPRPPEIVVATTGRKKEILVRQQMSANVHARMPRMIDSDPQSPAGGEQSRLARTAQARDGTSTEGERRVYGTIAGRVCNQISQ